MRTASPLRYPGGKSAMAGLLAEIRKLNGLGNCSFAEPFAGGAGAALSLLYLEETNSIYINDADSAIYNFWWTLIYRPKPFIDQISTVPLSIAEWQRQRAVYRSGRSISRIRSGFSAFYLNRCNRSGIVMNGGPIGGMTQKGKWKINARFNRAGLSRRCEKVSEYRDRIHVSCEDGIRFIKRLDRETTFFFIDPPYFEKGQTLYLNALDDRYHATLASRLKAMSDAAWVLTYDDCPEIRKMYKGWATIRPFELRYSAAERRTGKEVLITPKWMQLPVSQGSSALTW